MRTHVWKLVLIGAAIGIFGVLLHSTFFSLRRGEPDQSGLKESDRAQYAPPAHLNMPADQQPQQENPSARAAPPQPASTAESRLDQLAKMVAVYATSFRPGVHGAGSIPEFVEPVWREFNESGLKQLSEYSEHLLSPKDDWSADMEMRLRQFFEALPEMATTRVEIACRVNQCKLQVSRVHADPREILSSDRMISRLQEQPWYPERISDLAGAGNIGMPMGKDGSDAVSYTILTLKRRYSDVVSRSQ